jgi:hypothetical protein
MKATWLHLKRTRNSHAFAAPRVNNSGSESLCAGAVLYGGDSGWRPFQDGDRKCFRCLKKERRS